MNILIVGNGFDLSHYLPTKYDHFMVAMQAIEDWEESQAEMGFDDLFSSLYENEAYFFGYTKAMYKTEEIKISVDKIKELKKQLEENVWYQYFSDHVREVKTWIDFEQKIKDALDIICDFMVEIEAYLTKNNCLKDFIQYLEKSEDSSYYLSRKNMRILELFTLLNIEYITVSIDYSSTNVDFLDDWDESRQEISEVFLIKHKGYEEYLCTSVASFLHKSLLAFGNIFSQYLTIFNNVASEKQHLHVPVLESIDQIYSFNYTSTFSRLYKSNIKSYFLHGKIDDKNKIVLGVSDLNIEILRKFNLWGFTKYCQKLLLNTDYQFIEEFLLTNESVQQEIDLTKSLWLNRSADGTGSVKFIGKKVQNILKERSLDLNFYIWGHSLDYSDNVYVKELFSFNEPYDQNVKIVIYHFNSQAKFDLLANLIYILGKDKVEKWMKKGWLNFEENLDIAALNNIEPVELPKIAKA